jgi:hypothetical protein
MARRPAPNLLAAVGNRQKGQRLVAEALRDNAWIRDITGALSVLVIIQYLHLRERGDAIVLQLGVDDRVIWKCSSSGRYSARSAYAALTMGQTDLFGAKEAWKVRAPHEHKFFYLVSLVGPLRRHRRGISDDDTCALCDQDAETIDHLLVACVFSREVWFKAFRRCG